MKKIALSTLIVFVVLLFSCTNKENKQNFVKVESGQFTIAGEPYYYIGTNFWYGAVLGSTGEGGDRDRLIRELDFMKDNGIDNLRVLVGADGANGTPFRVEPTLQKSPGVYNDTIFDGLDFLLAEMGKREMYAVLYLNNSWEWTGGYMQYLEWSGYGKAPIPGVDGWPQFMEYVKQFHQCDPCKQLFKEYTHDVITRTNRYTGLKYTDDPAIMSWQIANEPRAFGAENKELYEAWLKETAAYIKSLDSNHLVSTGSEGEWGSEEDMDLYKRIHSDPNIDYLTIHIWPKNWSWLDSENIPGTLDQAIANTEDYINRHLVFADSILKPIAIEEFGLPRDNHQYKLSDPTTSRDRYYEYIFRRIEESSSSKGSIAGCNFWAWGGFARPAADHIFWQKGDDYMGDPGQEEQGLNAVFNTDATVGLVRAYNEKLSGNNYPANRKATPETVVLFQTLRDKTKEGIMIGHQDDLAYGIGWYKEPGRSDLKDVSGKYPAVFGWELGALELDHPYNLDSIYFSDMKDYARQVHDMGGINSYSWHVYNIATGNNAWDCKQDTVVRAVLPGGSLHEGYIGYMDRVADFFSSLKDKNGQAIPVLFRPYHEHTGSWFWWGANQSSPEEYSALWRMTYDYLTHEKQVHNLIWVYSSATVDSEAEYLERYPGNNFVDMLGFDIYLDRGREDYYIKKMEHNLDIVTNLGKRFNKIPLLSETGSETIPQDNYFTEIVWPVASKYPISYILLWRNAFNRENHFYAPYPGHSSAADFNKMAEDKRVIMINS